VRPNSQLRGFEKDFGRIICANFRWQDDDLRNRALVLGRNVFDKFLPDAEDIKATATEADNGFKYEAQREPALCIYRQPSKPFAQSISSDVKLTMNQLLVLRTMRPMADAVDLLDDLVTWLRDHSTGLRGERFTLQSVAITSAPATFSLGAAKQTYASSLLTVLAKTR
jgi:hypothetical protein